jgi:DNA-binding CsgD family transcriptional regulator
VIEKLKGTNDPVVAQYTTVLEANLKELTSSFGSSISSGMLGLTQKEITICNLIKTGLGSKQMAEALHVATRTIETHRNSIRKKLGISGKEVNLETYLNSMQ